VDGATLAFVVTSVEVAPKGELPHAVFAPHPVSVLVLITCTDDGTGPPGSYRDNLIVTAVPADPRAPAG
jgi:hypothetical protein